LSDPLPPPRSGGGGSPRSGETAGARAPLTPDERRLLDAAEGHFAQAAELISDTGYHRRDPELADLRRRLDLLRSR
jgi:hypothetical protein